MTQTLQKWKFESPTKEGTMTYQGSAEGKQVAKGGNYRYQLQPCGQLQKKII